MKCSANRIRSLYLRKTSCAKQRNTAEFVRLELQISRSEPTELCRRFPRRKLFSAVDQEFVMTHFAHRTAKGSNFHGTFLRHEKWFRTSRGAGVISPTVIEIGCAISSTPDD